MFHTSSLLSLEEVSNKLRQILEPNPRCRVKYAGLIEVASGAAAIFCETVKTLDMATQAWTMPPAALKAI